MPIWSAIMLVTLSSLSSALYVAFRYERAIRCRHKEVIAHLENDYKAISMEYMKSKLENARNEGIGIGRQCDFLQQQMINDLKEGNPISIRSGKHCRTNT